MMFNIAPGYEIATLLFFGLVVVICEAKYFISYFSVNVKTVIGQFGGSYSLGQVKKKLSQ